MKKVIFSTTIGSAGTGIMCNEDYTEPMFIAVGYAHGSQNYSYYLDGSAVSNGRSCTSASEAWEEVASYLGCDHILPVGQPQIKKWFGKEVYNEKLKEWKYANSEAARQATEDNKIKKKTQSGNLWLKSGKNGYWN